MPRFDFADYPQLTFEKPDTSVFKILSYAYYALKKGGNMPCILNAANEIAVEAFLNDKINFTGIFDIVETTLSKAQYIPTPSLEDLFETDKQARKIAGELV
jgi:1-deoxy-D-xylulose-5-phosphate reductoisomerase